MRPGRFFVAASYLLANIGAVNLYSQTVPLGNRPAFESSYNGGPMQMLRTPVDGQLEGYGGDASHLSIVLLDLANSSFTAQTQVSPLGNFSLASLPAGTYEVQVRNQQGDTVARTSISVPTTTTLKIKLGNAAPSPAAETVSHYRLTHRVPKAAAKGFRKALALLEKKDVTAARQQLQKTLAIDPDYALAHSLMGAIHLEEKDPEAARESFRKALALDPQESTAQTNLALALLRLNETAEAENVARDCLRANALKARARFYLALSLLEQGKPNKEALFHLTQAQDVFPPARALLAKLTSKP
jgi:tetratricopeptide (TPR) repeat protein